MTNSLLRRGPREHESCPWSGETRHMVWVWIVLAIVAWWLLSLPLAVAVGRAFRAQAMEETATR
ncbi:hypothetical protein GCM10009844_05190 [Nocardioides koreensis]|uniref:Uncharacterized protein n=1 Tax=Nocardioides koreensis TaxID=433651 RepID=A0ABN2Z751_9ACTN